MELTDFVAVYFRERSCSKLYRNNLLACARQLSEFLGGCELTSLVADRVNQWLEVIETTISKATAANKKRQIKTLWNAAHEAGYAPYVGRLRRIKTPVKIPEALTIPEIQSLLAVAKTQRGFFRGTKLRRSLYWQSLLMAYWDTALRLGDLRSIEANWIWPGGFLSIVQHKSQRTHRVQLRAETLTLIGELLAGRTTGLIWGILNKKNYATAQRRLFRLAGVRGSGKWIRRSSASYVERERPGTGWRHLGHAAPGLAERFYLDPKIVQPQPSLPPRLTG